MFNIFKELQIASQNFKKDLELKGEIRIIKDPDAELKKLGIENIEIVKLPSNDGNWDNKNTQYNGKKKRIEVNPEYDIELDENKEVLHEKCHVILNALGFANKANRFGRYTYPSNPLERIAYTTQFYHLLKTGKTPDEIRNNKSLKEHFYIHSKKLNAYLERATEEYTKDLIQEQILKQSIEK